jgi:peptidoglycan hydrolase CwlO-like protein
LQTEFTEVQGERSTLETGAAALGVAVVNCVADLIAVNINISCLESDVKSLNGVVTEYQRKTESNGSNIGTINGNIRSINTSITSFDSNVTVLEEFFDYITDISSINDRFTNRQE